LLNPDFPWMVLILYQPYFESIQISYISYAYNESVREVS